MLKVLIADDELIQRNGLANLIRKIRPTYGVFEAKNGQEALEISNTNPIDIIITDIKMPMMNGLEFIAKIHGSNQKAKIVILSGYRNFEFAQKALRFGAFDYLVKPIKEETIINLLEKVELKIEQELATTHEKEYLVKQLDSSLPIYYDHLLNNWIKGQGDGTELNEISQILSFSSSGVVLALNINNYETIVRNLRNQQIDEIKDNIKYKMQSVFDGLGHCISFFQEERKSSLVTILMIRNMSCFSRDSCNERLLKFIRDVHFYYGLDVIVGVGSVFRDIFEEARISLERAQSALLGYFYQQTTRIFYDFEMRKEFSSYSLDFSRYEETLKTAVKQNKVESIELNMEKIYRRATENVQLQPGQFVKDIIRMITNIAIIIRDLVDIKYYNELLTNIEIQLSECKEQGELKQKALDSLKLFADIIQSIKSRKHELVVDKCLKYIEENYQKNISLESVSSKFYFSPSYFSITFKCYVNMTFTKYLTQVRIKKALELLEKSDYKVYEIASKVGFKDDKYFYRVFKKEFGLTPDEYRRVRVYDRSIH